MGFYKSEEGRRCHDKHQSVLGADLCQQKGRTQDYFQTEINTPTKFDYSQLNASIYLPSPTLINGGNHGHSSSFTLVFVPYFSENC